MDVSSVSDCVLLDDTLPTILLEETTVEVDSDGSQDKDQCDLKGAIQLIFQSNYMYRQ